MHLEPNIEINNEKYFFHIIVPDPMQYIYEPSQVCGPSVENHGIRQMNMTFNPLSNNILGAKSQLSPSFLKVTLVHITSHKIHISRKLILC